MCLNHLKHTGFGHLLIGKHPPKIDLKVHNGLSFFDLLFLAKRFGAEGKDNDADEALSYVGGTGQ